MVSVAVVDGDDARRVLHHRGRIAEQIVRGHRRMAGFELQAVVAQCRRHLHDLVGQRGRIAISSAHAEELPVAPHRTEAAHIGLAPVGVCDSHAKHGFASGMRRPERRLHHRPQLEREVELAFVATTTKDRP